jgi:alanyl-tRNA synthetase
LIADGVLPSNEGRWYVLRRLLRRMYYHITHISKNPCDEKTVKNFSHQITQIIGDKFWQRYPHLQRQAHTINQTIYQELIQFQKTIDKGIKILNTRIEEKKNLTAHDAFFLYDSCGIPFELTQELCSHHQITLSLEEFNRELEQAKEKSRKNSSQMFKKTIDRSQYCDGLTATKYIWYNNLSLQSEDIRVLKQFSINNQDYIILNTTIFYAHGWWQTADKGLITIDNISYRVTDVIKYSDIFIHAIEKI